MDENGRMLKEGKDEWVVCRVIYRGMRIEEGRVELVGVKDIGHGGIDSRLCLRSKWSFWTNCFCLQGSESWMGVFIANSSAGLCDLKLPA